MHFEEVITPFDCSISDALIASILLVQLSNLLIVDTDLITEVRVLQFVPHCYGQLVAQTELVLHLLVQFIEVVCHNPEAWVRVYLASFHSLPPRHL